MQYDYYAFRKEQLGDRLHQLEQSDKHSRKQAAKNTFKLNQQDKQEQLEPHLPSLWYEVLGRDFPKNSIREAWQDLTTKPDSKLAQQIQALKQQQDAFEFTPNPSILDRLPTLSFMLRVPFKLRKPYLSKDDRAFHLLDNPVRKDKVFQTPMVAATGWKGALQSAMVQQLTEWWCELEDKDGRIHQKEFVARRVALGRLFGTEKGVQVNSKELENYLDSFSNQCLARWYRRYIRRYLASSGFFAGRLYFYPTFFDQIDLEVINPHDRKTGVGKNPILLECVPSGTTGELVILYVPFWPVEKHRATAAENRKDEEKRRKQEVADDLTRVAEGVEAMLAVYGFGAKTSSGYGAAEIDGKGTWAIRADLPDGTQPEPEVEPPAPKLPRYLTASGQLHPDFLNADGSFKSETEYLTGRSGKKAKQLYKKAKSWWEREGRQLAETPLPEPISEPEPLPLKSLIARREFNSFPSLVKTAEDLRMQIKNQSTTQNEERQNESAIN